VPSLFADARAPSRRSFEEPPRVGIEAVHQDFRDRLFGQVGQLATLAGQPGLRLVYGVHALHRAAGQVDDRGVDRRPLLRPKLCHRHRKLAVDREAARVDDAVERPHRLLVVGQRRQHVEDPAGDADILLAILVELIELRLRRLDLVERDLAHQPGAVLVLAHRKLERGGGAFERPRQRVGPRQRHSAAMTIRRHDRPAKLRRQQIGLDRGIEFIVMGDDEPARVRAGHRELARYPLTRRPDLNLFGVDRIGAAQHLRRRIGRVAPGVHSALRLAELLQ
jgi:hypothetical protein